MMMSMTHGTARHTPQIYIYIYITYTHIMSGAHIIYRSARPLLLLLAHNHTLYYSPCTIDISDLPIPFVSRGTLILAFCCCLFVCLFCLLLYIYYVRSVRSVPFRSREGEWYAEWRSNIIYYDRGGGWCKKKPHGECYNIVE